MQLNKINYFKLLFCYSKINIYFRRLKLESLLIFYICLLPANKCISKKKCEIYNTYKTNCSNAKKTMKQVYAIFYSFKATTNLTLGFLRFKFNNTISNTSLEKDSFKNVFALIINIEFKCYKKNLTLIREF